MFFSFIFCLLLLLLVILIRSFCVYNIELTAVYVIHTVCLCRHTIFFNCMTKIREEETRLNMWMKNAFNFENSYRRRSCQSFFTSSYLAYITYTLMKKNPLNAYAASQTITQSEMKWNVYKVCCGVAFCVQQLQIYFFSNAI